MKISRISSLICFQSVFLYGVSQIFDLYLKKIPGCDYFWLADWTIPYCFSKRFECFRFSWCFFVLLILFSSLSDTVHANGLFPRIEDLSSFTNVKTSSSCGLNNKQMTYCISSLSNNSIKTCTQRTCLLNCCQDCGTFSPSHIKLDNAQRSSGVFISADKHPFVKKLDSNSLNFQTNGFIIYSPAPAVSNFTFAVWMKQSKQNYGYVKVEHI